MPRATAVASGPTYSELAFAAEQGASVEAALWAARTEAGLRLARHRAELLRRALSEFREDGLARAAS